MQMIFELTFRLRILIVDFVQLSIVLGGVTALRRDVHDDEDVTLVLVQADGLALDVVDGELVDRLGGFGISLIS